MSDDILSQEVFTIDTGAGVLKEVKIEPLPLFSENHPMLRSEEHTSELQSH